MENQYDVGIANRYALFLEEGENELPVIKKKLSKEIRQKNKAIKKENAEARKAEAAKTPEKPKKPEPAPEAIEVSAPKKETKEEKIDVPKPKEKKLNDAPVNRKDKESQDKSRNVKNGGDAAVNDSWDTPAEVAAPEPVPSGKEFSKPFNENGPPRKNYERRPPRERKFENSDQNQSSRPYPNQYNRRNNNSYSNNNNNNNNNNSNSGNISGSNYYNKDDDWDAKNWGDKDGSDGGAAGDNATNRYQNNEPRNPRENGVSGPPYTTNEYRPRGGARFRGDSRGGRRNYNGPDRRRDYNNDQQNEQKDESNVFKSDSWGDENTENTNDVPTDNQKDEETKATENDANGTDEQKEVKEYLTLDEWKKLQGERQKPQYNLRKAGEGEDLTQWKNMRELEKKKDEEFLETNNRHEKSNHHEHEKENAGNENVQRVGRKKHIDINVHFRESSSRSRGARIIRNNRFGGGYKGRNEYRSDRDRNERSDRDRFDRERNDRSDRDRIDRGDRDRDRDRDRNDRNDRDRNDNNTYSGETRSFRKPREPREGGYIGRGGGNRGQPTTIRQNAPKMDDESVFPSLG